MSGSILCASHGANVPDERRERAETYALARMTSYNLLVNAMEQACSTYISIMKQGSKDADRIRAADRVLELCGIPVGKPLVMDPGAASLRPNEEPRDAHLLTVVQRIDTERAELLRQHAIGTVANEVTEVEEA